MELLKLVILRQYAVVIIVNFSVVALGLGLGWSSPVLVKLSDENQTVLPSPMTDAQGSYIVSIYSLAAVLGTFIPAFFIDRLGRKYSLLLACCAKITTCLLYVFAVDVWMILVGRAINGIMDMIIFNVIPMYASEVASKEIRGSLGSILQISAALGVLIMFSTGPFISYLALNLLVLFVSVLSTIPILFLPESPYFLYYKGNTENALKVLTFFRGSTELAQEEINEYSKSLNEQSKISLRELLSDKIVLKTLGIVIILGLGNPLVGFSAVQFYLQTILDSTPSNLSSEISSVILGCIQLTASILTGLVTDRFGRKPIIIVTLIMMSLGMIGLGLSFQLRGDEPVSGFLNYLPLVSLIVVMYGYCAGYGTIFWMLIAELFEGPARAIGVNCSLITSNGVLFLITLAFPFINSSLGPAAIYFIFGANCLIFCVFTVFCIPETKGKSFAEIQIALGAKRTNTVSEIDETKKI